MAWTSSGGEKDVACPVMLFMVSQVRATTLGGYRHNVRAYLVPRLGDIPLQRLTTARVGAFYGELVASGGKGGRPGQAAPRPPGRDAYLGGRAGRNLPRVSP
jgi:hypothetical protein